MEDIHITGSSSMHTGEYQSIMVSGVGKCEGPVRALDIGVMGTFKVEGDTECRTLTVNGSFKCEGSLAAEETVCNGTATIEESMIANVLTVNGMLHVEGDRLGGGELKCAGILTADRLVSCNDLQVTGLIKAESIEGGHVYIHSHRPALLIRFLPSVGLSKTESITGEHVDLSGVTAEMVTGAHITIGPDCRIGKVRCYGTLSIDPAAAVGEVTGEYEMR